MSRARITFVEYLIKSDPSAEDEYNARCVFGEESECGATSGTRSDHGVTEWQRQHVRETGHTRFLRSIGRYEVWEPKEPVPAPTPVEPKDEP